MSTPARPPRLPRSPRRPRALALSIALALVASAGCGGAPGRSLAVAPAPTGAGDPSGKPPKSDEDGAAIVLEPLDVGPRVITLGEIPIEGQLSEPAEGSDEDGLSPRTPRPPPTEGAGKGRGKGDDVLPQEPQDRGTELGVTTSAGAFDADAVERVVREGLPGVRRCYDRELASSEGARATVTFTIGRSGRVTSVETEIEAAGAPGAGALRTCVEEVVSSWRFPAPEAPRRVVTPLRFAPRPE